MKDEGFFDEVLKRPTRGCIATRELKRPCRVCKLYGTCRGKNTPGLLPDIWGLFHPARPHAVY